MAYSYTTFLSEKRTNSIIFDLSALVVITLTPALSHMYSLPFYLLEPMRIMLILALVHTSKSNALILAIILPLFSFLISSNPVLYKMLLITSELLINVWLFYFLYKKTNNAFLSMLLSILLSKLYYYPVKLGLISSNLLKDNIFDTSFYVQVIVASVLSLYTYFILKRTTSRQITQ